MRGSSSVAMSFIGPIPTVVRGWSRFACNPQVLSRNLTTTMAASDAATARNSDTNAAALIVGASRGIGLAMSQALSRRFKGELVSGSNFS